MWSEELDNNLRNAADKDIPPYDEKTWDGMHQLLEKHLPQKKKRRGIIFFLFLALMLLIPGIFMITKFSSHTDSVAQKQPSDNTNTTTTTATPTNNVPVAPNDNTGNNNNSIADKKSISNSTNPTPIESPANTNSQTAAPSISTPANNTTIPAIRQSTGNNTATPIASNVKNSGSKKVSTQKNNPSSTKGNASPALVTTSATAVAKPSAFTDNNEGGKSSTTVTTPVATATVKKQTTTTSQPVSTPANTVGAAIISNATATTTAAVEKPVVKTPAVDSAITTTTNPVVKNKQQLPAKKGNKLSFTLSIGPDVTSVGVDRLGKVKGQVGIGVGYAITNKLGVRAGFLAGRKIYSADSTSYHTPDITGPYRLYNIDANCFVYEIPVSFTYSLGATEKHNWFVSGGLSSYIMKEEKYLYTYKSSPSSLTSYYYEHDLRNENKHFFSVLNLSGGYQYNVSKHLSLMAEPYIKLPMTGIGAGKVRLNSTGILFTVAVRPFAR